MMKLDFPQRPFAVGTWRVDPESNRVETDGSHRVLEPKVMEVMVALASNAGHTVTREQLMDRVWPDSCVESGSLTRCVSMLRNLFGDRPGRPQIIETVRKRGYRWIAPITFAEDGGSVGGGHPSVDPWQAYVRLLTAA